MKLWEKVGIGATFAVGTLSIVASTVRVVSIGSKSGNDSTPSSTWLALWGMVEGAIGEADKMCMRYPALTESSDRGCVSARIRNFPAAQRTDAQGVRIREWSFKWEQQTSRRSSASYNWKWPTPNTIAF